MPRAPARAAARSRAFRIVTGALARNGGGRTGKRLAWQGFLTVAPFGAAGEESEGEGAGATPADALKAAVDDLAKQGALDDGEGA